jgi:hypothetical protein
MDLRRGSLVRHLKFGLTYIGGSSNNRVSLHNLKDGKRITKSSKREDLQVLSYNSWRFYQVPSGSYIRRGCHAQPSSYHLVDPQRE